MPQKHAWNTRSDARLARLRRRGFSWETIAFAFRLNRTTVIRRGMRIGLRLPPRPLPLPPDPGLTDPARDPLRAGHPLSWGLLTAGTLLEGVPYPWPPTPQDEEEEASVCAARAEEPARAAPLAPASARRGRAGAGVEVAHAPSA